MNAVIISIHQKILEKVSQFTQNIKSTTIFNIVFIY